MAKKRLMVCKIFLMFLFLLLPSFLSAQMREYKDYTVIKRDTLWDISKKELKDPFLWPKIWKENPEIPNPDKIYPEQIIKIPLYILQKEIPEAEIPETKLEIKPEIEIIKKEEPKKEITEKIEPVKKEYLVDRNLLISSGYIADSVPNVGKIVGSPSSRNLLGKGDYAYIKTVNPTKIGEKFYVIRSVEKVTHPKSGDMLGYLIEVLGIAEVVGQDNNETEVKITSSYSDILTESLLDNFYEIEPPLAIEPPRRPDINGYIVATRHLHMINGIWDIVYIDRGRKDGLEVGDILATTLLGEHKIINGLVQVINLRGSTATAIVRKSNDMVTKGDGIARVK
ncbi:MAG: LysM peptidoglycan-binding domain-containing protein [Nitrospirota bacterium]